jgi:hypothetical protein
LLIILRSPKILKLCYCDNVVRSMSGYVESMIAVFHITIINKNLSFCFKVMRSRAI